MEPSVLIEKFRANAGERVSAKALDEIAERVLGLERERELGPLLRRLRL
jgi:hypothetical protein